jgi:hypothetical protein
MVVWDRRKGPVAFRFEQFSSQEKYLYWKVHKFRSPKPSDARAMAPLSKQAKATTEGHALHG